MKRIPFIRDDSIKLYIPQTAYDHEKNRGTLLHKWPKCYICKDAVKALGIGDEGSRRIEIWAECDHGTGRRQREYIGILFDQDTWNDVPQSVKTEKLRALTYFKPTHWEDDDERR